jgi:hypothetical protein
MHKLVLLRQMKCNVLFCHFQFICDDPNIEINEEDQYSWKNDLDFEEDSQEGSGEEITLTDFTNVDVYDCCEAKGRQLVLGNYILK